MKKELLMERDGMEEIICRLYGCKAVLDAIHITMEDTSPNLDAVFGAADLLSCICRDFQADIETAECYAGKGTTA